ncbi:MAG: MATE family efflux transporter, partial [Methanobacteriaceae archaeon]|nr:MATE family efflux transporter [Methanobacteriaceae archaeon]
MESDTNKYILSNVFKSFFITGIFQATIMNLSIIVDGILIGNFLGVNAIAAFGIITPIELLLMVIGLLFSQGGLILSSKYLGRNDKESSNQIFTTVCLLGVFFGLLIAGLLFLFSENVSVFFGANTNIITLSSDFLKGISFGVIFYILELILMKYTKMDGSNNLTIYATICSLITNVLLDLIVIFMFNGHLFGIGLATSISYLVGFLVYLTHFLKEKNSIHLTKITNIKSHILNISKSGSSGALNKLLTTTSRICLNNLIIIIGGTLAMGSLSIFFTIYNLICDLIHNAIAEPILTISGLLYGASDYSSLKRMFEIYLRNSIIFSLILTVILLLFATNIVSLYTSDIELINRASFGIKLFSLSLIPVNLNYILLNHYNSINKIVYSNYISFAKNFIFLFIPFFIFEPFIGVDAVWVAFCL